MGSTPQRKTLNVLITGFGPWGVNTTNPAHLIALALPTTLHLPSHPHLTINLHPHPSPLRVSYAYVSEILPRLLFPEPTNPVHGNVPLAPSSSPADNHTAPPQPSNPNPPSHQRPNFDFTLLIGMAGGRNYYTLETTAHNSGYETNVRDAEGAFPPADWAGADAPPVLEVSIGNLEDVLERWREGIVAQNRKQEEEVEEEVEAGEMSSNNDAATSEEGRKNGKKQKSKLRPADVRLSADAGRYLCEFSLYTALLEYWRRGREGRVCFLHVPGLTGVEDIGRGVQAATALIEGVVAGLEV